MSLKNSLPYYFNLSSKFLLWLLDLAINQAGMQGVWPGDVSIQTKKYTLRNLPSAKYIEGDIRQVIRTLPYLQVYVLAVSRDVAQLRDTLDAIEEETGVDIVTLELNDEISDPRGIMCLPFGKIFATSLTYQTQIKNSWSGLKK